MKRTFIFAVFLSVFSFCAASAYAASVESETFTPYFNMSFRESAFMASVGDFFTGGAVSAETGLLANIDEKNEILGVYFFNYNGPGFQPQEEGQFSERNMSHNVNLEYRRRINYRLRVRPSFSWSKEYRRMGLNEAWENGLYNTDSVGFGLALDYYGRAGVGQWTFSYNYRNIGFPNYTDLLLEFQNAGLSAELSGGLYDQDYHEFSLNRYFGKHRGQVSFILQKYKNQRIIENDGTGGGVYGSGLQEDKTFSLLFGTEAVWGFLKFYPSLSYSLHRSNQNFVRYKYLGDTSPDFIADNYDYNEAELAVPIELMIKGRWAVTSALSVSRRAYTDRPARDSNNNYKSEKQKNTFLKIDFGFKRKMNEIAYMAVYYSVYSASSNNKFENYLPYNYTGNSLSLVYEIKY